LHRELHNSNQTTQGAALQQRKAATKTLPKIKTIKIQHRTQATRHLLASKTMQVEHKQIKYTAVAVAVAVAVVGCMHMDRMCLPGEGRMESVRSFFHNSLLLLTIQEQCHSSKLDPASKARVRTPIYRKNQATRLNSFLLWTHKALERLQHRALDRTITCLV
jgi:hypothetical protein